MIASKYNVIKFFLARLSWILTRATATKSTLIDVRNANSLIRRSQYASKYLLRFRGNSNLADAKIQFEANTPLF